MPLPRLYAIADTGLLAQHGLDLLAFTQELAAAGVTLIQYRNKTGSPREQLRDAARLRQVQGATNLQLIFNDRADLALLSGFDGLHVGQEDLAPADARRILPAPRLLGVSTHSPQQLLAADQTPCDYIAYGPIFPTHSKQNPDPVVGLDGLRHARTLTQKPLVAIGGITLANCRSVLDAGADSVALISALVPTMPDQSTRQLAEEFLARLA